MRIMTNQRKRGNNYEVKIMNRYNEIGYECVTSRSESKRMDDAGVDLVFLDGSDIKPQIKLTSSTPSVKKYMEDGISNVILWARCEKVKKNSVIKGEYAIIPMEQYFELIKYNF